MPAITATSDIGGSAFTARVASAASTNATVVKADAGNVYGWSLAFAKTPAASLRYVKFYDKATAPNPASDVPKFTLPIISTTTVAGIAEFSSDEGIPFKNGIAYLITGGVADTDATAVAADDIHGVILYK